MTVIVTGYPSWLERFAAIPSYTAATSPMLNTHPPHAAY